VPAVAEFREELSAELAEFLAAYSDFVFPCPADEWRPLVA
jgi:hypothetical protein